MTPLVCAKFYNRFSFGGGSVRFLLPCLFCRWGSKSAFFEARKLATTIDTAMKAKRNNMISELINFRITKAKAKMKFGVKSLCGHECERSSVQTNFNTKAKAKKYFRGIHFTLLSVSTVLWRMTQISFEPEFGSGKIRESFCESSEGVRLPRERGWPPGKSGNFRGSLGNFRGSLGNFRGTSGLLLSSTVRELPGKSPKNFRGSLGNFRGSRGTSQKLGGAWLPPSDSPNLSPQKEAAQRVWTRSGGVRGATARGRFAFPRENF